MCIRADSQFQEFPWTAFILGDQWPSSLSALPGCFAGHQWLSPRVIVHVILTAVYILAQSKTRRSLEPSPTLLSLPLSHLLGLPHLCPRGSPGYPRHHQLHTHTALPLQLVGCQADLILKRRAGSSLIPRRGLKADTLALFFSKAGFSSNIHLTK